jgi:membrane protein DedA with SNARE-associated domain
MVLARFLPASAASAVVWAVVLLLPIYFLPGLLEWLSSITGISATTIAPAPVPAP